MTGLSADEIKAQIAEMRRRGQVGRLLETEAKLKSRVTADLQDFVSRKKGKTCDQS